MCSLACTAIWRASFEGRSVSDIAVRVRNVTKDFQIYDKPADLALEILTRKKRHRAFRALDDVSFDVERGQDRKSTRLNSSHVAISYAVFCLKKKKTKHTNKLTKKKNKKKKNKA